MTYVGWNCGCIENATVDTDAYITIVSQKVYDSMQPKPHIFKSNIRLAGEGTVMRVQFLVKV